MTKFITRLLKIGCIAVTAIVIFCAAAAIFIGSGIVMYPYRNKASANVFEGHRLPPGVKYHLVRLKPEKDVTLEGYITEPVNAPKPVPTIILLHGICSNKDAFPALAGMLSQQGFRVAAFDSRAHGNSTGTCTYGWYEKQDVSKIIDEIEKEDPGSRVGIYGNSMGGAIAVQALASDKRIRCGMIESTFADFREAAKIRVKSVTQISFDPPLAPALWLAGLRGHWKPDEVRPEIAARSIEQPVYMTHGTADDVLPISQGERIFKNLKSPAKEWLAVAGGHHENLGGTYGPAYEKRMVAFFKRWLPNDARTPTNRAR